MSPLLTIERFPPLALGKIIELLDLLASLRSAAATVTTAEGLRNVLDLLGRLAALAGVDSSWINRLQSILADQNTFSVVLSIVQYVDGLLAPPAKPTGPTATAVTSLTVDAQSFADWLPLVMQLIHLLKAL